MFHLNRMQILFKLRRNYRESKKGKPKPVEVAIYARITVNGQTADTSTNIKINPKYWNQAKQRVTDAAPTADQDNETLDRIKVRLKKAFNLLDQDDAELTPGQVLELYRGKKRVRYSISQVIRKFMEDQKDRISDDPDELATKGFITQDTYETNDRYNNNILEYLGDSKQERAFIEEIDEAWLNDFKKWGNKRFATNYLAKHLYHIKRLVDFAVLKKYTRTNPIAPYKIDTEEPDPDELVFLSPEELRKLQTFDFSTLPIKQARIERLDRVRDAFLFMQAIGTHLGEYNRFVSNPDQSIKITDGIWFVKKKRQKTKKYMIAPLKPICFELATKYGGFSKLPTYSRTQFNDGLTLISAYLGFDKELTSKAARKTFADHNLNEEATDVNTTAKMMGLSSTQYLKHYGHIDERRMIRELGLKPQIVQES
ncbi:phage integrase SAM-like domain-containing protein [Spirosoma aerolatum]|uniref:phage integrase SAM-like domain-containing protein n=1 Tax=Spirosoma aerolatum TaxID=1211326 RepID=UPI0009ADD960|nr:phage integrase SAM-like domain-containing protein [Spirosoma aerolatum]